MTPCRAALITAIATLVVAFVGSMAIFVLYRDIGRSILGSENKPCLLEQGGLSIGNFSIGSIKVVYDCEKRKEGEKLQGKIELQPTEDGQLPDLVCTSALQDSTGRNLTPPETVDIEGAGTSNLPTIELPPTDESIAASVNVECSTTDGIPVLEAAAAVQIEPES